MTCIVGIAQGGTVILGANSAGVAGYNLDVRADPKVYRNGPCILGFTTSWRMGQLLAFSMRVPERQAGQDLFAYMVTDFVEAARVALTKGGFTTITNNNESAGHFLVGIEGRLFRIEGDFQVGETLTGYDAVGSGAPYALGALFSISARDSLQQRAQAALSAAERFSAGVREPFHFQQIP